MKTVRDFGNKQLKAIGENGHQFEGLSLWMFARQKDIPSTTPIEVVNQYLISMDLEPIDEASADNENCCDFVYKERQFVLGDMYETKSNAKYEIIVIFENAYNRQLRDYQYRFVNFFYYTDDEDIVEIAKSYIDDYIKEEDAKALGEIPSYKELNEMINADDRLEDLLCSYLTYFDLRGGKFDIDWDDDTIDEEHPLVNIEYYNDRGCLVNRVKMPHDTLIQDAINEVFKGYKFVNKGIVWEVEEDE